MSLKKTLIHTYGVIIFGAAAVFVVCLAIHDLSNAFESLLGRWIWSSKLLVSIFFPVN